MNKFQTILRSLTSQSDKLERVKQFLATGNVEPFRYCPEKPHQTVLRLSASGVSFFKSLLSVIPFTGTLSFYVASLYYLIRYGPLCVVSSSELVEAIGLILKLVQAAEFDHPSFFRLAFSDLPLRLYYAMAENRTARGDVVREQQPVSVHSMKDLEKFCSLAVNVGYVSDPVEAQRLLRHQGFTLILHEVNRENGCYPFMLACGKAEAVLLLPGTQGLGDVTVDVNAFECEVSLGEKSGKAHKGMVQEAIRLENALCDILSMFVHFKVSIAGHSLGAGVGALLTTLLHRKIKNINFYGFGSPPCVSESIADALQEVCTNVVLRDDVVCRATTGNVDRLLTRILSKESSDRFNSYMRDDLKDIRNNWTDIIKLKHREHVPYIEKLPAEEKLLTLHAPGNMFRKLFLWSFSRKKKPLDETDNELVQHRDGFVLPGKVVYLSKKFGDTRYACQYIPRSAKTLNQIEIQPHMLSDHYGDHYLQAIRDSLLNSATSAPLVTPSLSGSRCSLCGSDFLYNSILKNKNHANFAKRVCGRCQGLVCHACSSRKRVDPGRIFPIRVCDKCWLTPPFPSKL